MLVIVLNLNPAPESPLQPLCSQRTTLMKLMSARPIHSSVQYDMGTGQMMRETKLPRQQRRSNGWTDEYDPI